MKYSSSVECTAVVWNILQFHRLLYSRQYSSEPKSRRQEGRLETPAPLRGPSLAPCHCPKVQWPWHTRGRQLPLLHIASRPCRPGPLGTWHSLTAKPWVYRGRTARPAADCKRALPSCSSWHRGFSHCQAPVHRGQPVRARGSLGGAPGAPWLGRGSGDRLLPAWRSPGTPPA